MIRWTSPALRLVAPLAATGALVAGYLLTRPYGDSPAVAVDLTARAHAFASPAWVFSHACGALGLASVAWVAARLDGLPGADGWSRAARRLSLLGAVLVLPYYGAEMTALHEIGVRALAGDPGVMALVEPIRNQPVAMSMFGAGLLALAGASVSMGVSWWRRTRSLSAVPFAGLVAGVLPQFYLPPVGRMAYGVAYALAAAGWIVAALIEARETVDSPLSSLATA